MQTLTREQAPMSDAEVREFDLEAFVRTTLEGATGDAEFASQDDAVTEIAHTLSERAGRPIAEFEHLRIARVVAIQWNAIEEAKRNAQLIAEGATCPRCGNRFATGDVILDSREPVNVHGARTWKTIYAHESCATARLDQALSIAAKSGVRGLRLAMGGRR